MKTLIGQQDAKLGLAPVLGIDPEQGIVFGATGAFGPNEVVTLTNTGAQQAYNAQLGQYERANSATEDQAIAHDGTTDAKGQPLPDQERIRGVMTRFMF